jgi:intracellular sulfur oxidation DsrE/DsrF family protein
MTMKKIVIAFILVALSYLSRAQEFQYPAIKEYGGVVNYDNALRPKEGVKILVDLTTSKTTADGINKGWEKVARMINLYAISDISMDQMKIVVIVHGGATKSILSNEAYNSKYNVDNPDLPLIRAVQEAGVKVSVCSQAIAHRGFSVEGVDTSVELALSAITVLVDHQKQDYALIYFN